MKKDRAIQDTSCKVTNCFCIKGKTMDEIKVEKTSTSYRLTKQIDVDCASTIIYAHVEGDKLTIMPNNAYSKFEFRKSKSETVQDIAELMLAAVELINKNKKESKR